RRWSTDWGPTDLERNDHHRNDRWFGIWLLHHLQRALHSEQVRFLVWRGDRLPTDVVADALDWKIHGQQCDDRLDRHQVSISDAAGGPSDQQQHAGWNLLCLLGRGR